jgi:hypothetical protein
VNVLQRISHDSLGGVCLVDSVPLGNIGTRRNQMKSSVAFAVIAVQGKLRKAMVVRFTVVYRNLERAD